MNEALDKTFKRNEEKFYSLIKNSLLITFFVIICLKNFTSLSGNNNNDKNNLKKNEARCSHLKRKILICSNC